MTTACSRLLTDSSPVRSQTACCIKSCVACFLPFCFCWQELTSRRPLLPSSWDFKNDLNFSSTVVDTLETFRLAAKLPKKSLGAYVISQCQQASDILAVMVLQQNAG